MKRFSGCYRRSTPSSVPEGVRKFALCVHVRQAIQQLLPTPSTTMAAPIAIVATRAVGGSEVTTVNSPILLNGLSSAFALVIEDLCVTPLELLPFSPIHGVYMWSSERLVDAPITSRDFAFGGRLSHLEFDSGIRFTEGLPFPGIDCVAVLYNRDHVVFGCHLDGCSAWGRGINTLAITTDLMGVCLAIRGAAVDVVGVGRGTTFTLIGGFRHGGSAVVRSIFGDRLGRYAIGVGVCMVVEGLGSICLSILIEIVAVFLIASAYR